MRRLIQRLIDQPKEYLRLLYGDFDEVVYTYVDAAAAKTRCPADTAERAVDPTSGSRRA
jgi:hypothetical protein